MPTFHFHKKYELYYLVNGTRRYFIGNASYLVNAGDLVIIPPDQIHKTDAVEEGGHTRYVLNFNEETIRPLARENEGELLDCFTRDVRIVRTPMRQRRLIESLLQRLNENECSEDFSLLKRRILLCELLVYTNEFARAQESCEPMYGKVHHDLIEAVQQYISTNYQETLNLSTIAAKFYISPSYLSRLFKRVTNLSIVEYINGVRVMNAKNLLEKSENKIVDIAHQSGFSNTVHFTRVFKDGTGLSPHQYRKFYKKSSEPQH